MVNSLSAFLVSFALLAPAAAGVGAPAQEPVQHVRQSKAPPVVSAQRLPPAFSPLRQSIVPEPWGQVRIEQRVIIRIAPSPPAAREQMLSRLPRRQMETSYEEVETDRCVPVGAIAGVAPVRQNRLLLFMRDRRVLSAALERKCDAQAFYSGFYVERSEDGMLCVGRDMLQSRAGTSCGVAQFNRLVAVRD